MRKLASTKSSFRRDPCARKLGELGCRRGLKGAVNLPSPGGRKFRGKKEKKKRRRKDLKKVGKEGR